MFTEDIEEELDYQPCPLCGEDDNEDHLLACDGCGVEFHTYCASLDQIPVGHWFCDTCETQRAIESVSHPARQAQFHRPPNRRTRAQRRLARGYTQASSSSWARVWQSVWDRLNLDLDFPFDEDSVDQQRRELEEWQRRLQVAQRQGGAHRFRDTAPALLPHRTRGRSRQPTAEAESPDEIRAWNAFEKAKEIQAGPSNSRRKRKSATSSPSEPEPVPQPERQLKRPRTRRTLDLIESSSDASADVDSRRAAAAGSSSSRNIGTTTHPQSDQGPSFLQSLLKEVESSSPPDRAILQPQPLGSGNDPLSGLSSPRASPTSSNHASPRALSTTPPPNNSVLRPGSPLSLTSKVEPVYPTVDFSPSTSPTDRIQHRFPEDQPHRPEEARAGCRRNVSPPASSPPRSTNASPNRLTMSLAAKSDLQKLVSAALKPHYKNNTVNKDQYTDINRNVSRMLYDRVGDTGANGENKDEWERIATDEVDKAVKALQTAS